MFKLKNVSKVVHIIVVLIMVTWVVLPLYWLFVTSVTPQVHLAGTRTPTMVPKDFTVGAYTDLLFPGNGDAQGYRTMSPADNFMRSMFNSTVVAVISTVLGLIFGSLAAYSLARFRFKSKKIWRAIILGSRMIAPVALAIPLYVVFRIIGVLDTYIPLIIVYTSLNMAWSTLIMLNYFNMLPEELEDAARIDGCSYLQAFYKVVLPMAAPGLVAVTIITFLRSWGEFLFALIFTHSISARTMPVVVSMFVGEFAVQYRLIAAAIILGIGLPVIISLMFQRFIVAGLTAGSVKG